MARRPPKRDADLTSKSGVKKKLLDLYKDVEKGFEDQRDRADDTLDNWDLYNCKLGEKQFYAGTSKIFIPFVRDAVKARVTRFVNQIFPQSGRFVEVTTAEADPPQATQALIEGYVRKCKLRTQIMPALIRNGDVEGQYTVYASWQERERHVIQRVKVQPKTDGLPNEAAEPVDDFEEEEIVDAYPDVEVISDVDLCVLPATVDSIEEALDVGGSVTVIRRWTKAKIKKLIEDGDIVKEAGEALLESMSQVRSDQKADTEKKNADAAGIKGRGKHALIYETWHCLKVEGFRLLCRIYYGGEDQVLGCKQNPFWNDRCPVISAPVEKVAGVFKGQAPVGPGVSDLQIFANDTINEGADSAHFSMMPIVMTDPLKNPRVDTLVLGLAALWECSPEDTKIVTFPELWRSALERAGAIKEQLFQTLGVNPAMVPQQTGGAKKRNQAEIANEQQVDILTTADMVTVIEESILTPLVQRFAEYDHQYRDEATTVRVYGEMGLRANMEEVEPIQLNNRFEFRWYGVEAARNAAQMQQQIAWVNVVKGMPPEAYPDYTLDIAPMIVQGTENVFGPRLAPLIFKRKTLVSVDPMVENNMMEHGFRAEVHPADDDAEHIQEHMLVLMTGDPHGTIRDHIAKHQMQMQAKAAAQAMQQPSSGGKPGGGPRSGGQPTAPRQMKQPAGAIHPDQMSRAGAAPMPRKM